MALKKPRKPILQESLPAAHDWRTTDEQEVLKRRARAQTEALAVASLERHHPIFGNFQVRSGSGRSYQVEIRSLARRQFACECVDFQTNGLGTCKHTEAVLLYLEARHPKAVATALATDDSPRIDVVPDREAGTLRLERGRDQLPARLRTFFFPEGRATADLPPEELLEALRHHEPSGLRISLEVEPWLAARQHERESRELRRQYERKVQQGEWPPHETKVPLFPYQREGMLHLAFVERGLLADEMGLGKTIQAIAACALLHRLGQARRVLVVTPASLKTEWEEQIQRFTGLPYQLVFGQRHTRVQAYGNAPFFTIVNYEQILHDLPELNARLQPDIVILDEAQRIKNWNTKTAQAVKRLRSRYAFVLTGTPLENRIDELYSLMEFLNPAIFGPLFRFNREFYELDDRGRPCGFKNLERLHERIRPYMLRRRKADVETELPDRTERVFFVPLTSNQRQTYEDHEAQVARLMSAAKRRPLSQQEQDKLMRELAMMRMICDTNYILDPEDRECPKLGELEKILEECRENNGTKVIIFSEWERMLELVRERCEQLGLAAAWHTGSVPQRRRRAEINLFKTDPHCRVFLSTDSGSTGLNLQNASYVINCDLPWNPAKLEQRIARAWRKGQTKPVTVINLVTENTIEHRMLSTLANKQALADGILDRRGDLSQIKFGGGRQAFLAKLEAMMASQGPATRPGRPLPPPLPVDRSLAFAERARAQLGDRLLRAEERFPSLGAHSVLLAVVDRDAALHREKLAVLHSELLGQDQNPLAPVQLEVLDRSTFEALERLIAAGIIAPGTRAVRQLFPAPQTDGKPALSEAEQQQVAAHRAQAARKLKIASVLIAGDLADEARPALLESALWTAKALALEQRLPEPAKLDDTLLASWSLAWGPKLEVIRSYLGDPGRSCAEILEVLK